MARAVCLLLRAPSVIALPPPPGPRRARWVARALGVGLLVAPVGCHERGLAPTRPCVNAELGQRVMPIGDPDVDLLVVVDGAVPVERERVVRWVADAAQRLFSGDFDDDGWADARPIGSLHVGVITSNLGAGASTGLAGCAPGLGDDGVVRDFAALREGDDVEGAVSRLLPDELFDAPCGLSKPLEAALKALSPRQPTAWTAPGYVPPRFASADGRPNQLGGHGDTVNAAFLRPSSDLVVVLLTGQDDCSLADPRALESTGSDAASIRLRCLRAEASLHPIERYVAGFSGLRRSAPVVLTAIAGVPPDPASRLRPLESLLADPAMTPRPDARDEDLVPSCTGFDGPAHPPLRITRVAAGLHRPALGRAASICMASDGVLGDTLVSWLGDAHPIGCLPSVPVRPDGSLDCTLFELLPAPGSWGAISECAGLPGRSFDGVIDDGDGPRQVCVVDQIAYADRDTRPGWYVVTTSPCYFGQRRMSASTPAVEGAEYRLSCAYAWDVPRASGAAHFACTGDRPCTVGMGCDSDDDRCATGHAGGMRAGPRLFCDPIDRACAAPCVEDADCVRAGLAGRVCDLRPLGDLVDPGQVPDALRDRPRGVCVSPTCDDGLVRPR